ncbi:MAG TPA: hypothetical protein VHL78_06845 [Actinomycetota bacterium]|nr:hypothetical protein [Actinomycetota bacterium]
MAGRQGGPRQDLRQEAIRVLDAAEASGLLLRAVGGLGVYLLCPSARVSPLAREYKDLDLAGRRGEAAAMTGFLRSLGYEPDEEFNAIHGHRQLYFWDPVHRRQLDVFVERIRLSHDLDVGHRLHLSPQTLAPADLLLTKLQVVEVNEKDLKDACALLADQPLAPDGIDPDRVVEVLTSDWGWWRTCTATLDSVARYAAGLEGFAARDRVLQSGQELRDRTDAAPKGVRWRVRAIVGERVRWYELPEETGT